MPTLSNVDVLKWLSDKSQRKRDTPKALNRIGSKQYLIWLSLTLKVETDVDKCNATNVARKINSKLEGLQIE